MARWLPSVTAALACLPTLGGCSFLERPEPYHRAAPQGRTEPEKDYYRELPDGEHALRRITDPAALPDLSAACRNTEQLLPAVERSLSYLAKPSSKEFFPVSGIRHERVVASLEAFKELLAADLTPEELEDEVRRRFDVYTSVGCDDRGTVLFTGYYTPIFRASRVETDEYRYPLHRPPENHVKDPLTGETKGLRRPDGSIDPDYPDREALLESDLLEGRELVWLRDPFEAYVVGVQGSAILELRDGSYMEVGYAGNNGHPYSSVGQALVDSGRLRREELNLHSMIEYFQENPEEFAPLAAENARYVFFREGDGGPYGCLNEPVTAMRSIATDKSIFPRASLCLIEADLPVKSGDPDGRYRGFALDQDAGGAIRAPGRCDVYMGIGEAAGELAGRTLSEGRLYYLLLTESES